MRLSIRIFTAFGIPVRLHISMLLIPFIAYSWMPGSDLMSFLIGLSLAVLLFASVVAHEFGHALVGRRYGVVTQDIVLTPIGGMARMQAIPRNPAQEIAISIAGPAVSFAIAAVSAFVLHAAPMMPLMPGIILLIAQVLFQLNLMLALFNLVPALPMDGGRVFRGLLSMKYGHIRATVIASRVGKGLALAGGLYGLVVGSWTLVFIAWFVYSFARQEESQARYLEMLEQMAKSQEPPSGASGFYVYSSREEGRTPGRPFRASADPGIKVIDGGKVEVVSRKDPDSSSE